MGAARNQARKFSEEFANFRIAAKILSQNPKI